MTTPTRTAHPKKEPLVWPPALTYPRVNTAPVYEIVANWPERRSHHWKSLLVARAIENQCYVAGLNRVGEDGKQLTYTGDSNVYNALGEKLAPDAPGKEEIITVLLSKEALLQVRQNLNFLKDA